MTPEQALDVIEQMRLAWTGGNGRDHDLLREAVVVLRDALLAQSD